jgi:hypothetical protein
MGKKITIKSWIVRAELSDGRTVNLDLDNQSADAVDSFITELEKNQDWEDYVVDIL